jgi:hypothetical protein
MKFTITEAAAILSKQMGYDVEIVSDSESDEWDVNTQTIAEYPYPLSHSDKIHVIFSDGTSDTGVADSWSYSWDTTGTLHIVKYRKLD